MAMLENLEEAEKRWLSTLSLHCNNLFEGVFLPSHDHLHHIRVWSHARRLIQLLDRSGIELPDHLPEELIISVFFHDVGLIRTPGEQHGLESRRLCEEFFEDHVSDQTGQESKKVSRVSIPAVPAGDSLNRILHAIEHHDDKSLKSGSAGIRPGVLPQLLGLLSASDDLDAFGKMGIYRYAEIYLLRGISPEELPGLVCDNVQNRYNNLKNIFGELKDFINEQEGRFRQVYNFYLNLAQGYAGQDERPVWEPQLIRIIYNALLREENLLETDRSLPETDFETEIGDWFRALDKENSGRDMILKLVPVT